VRRAAVTHQAELVMTNVKFREGGYGTDWVAFAKQ
jgi:hypothetical protein